MKICKLDAYNAKKFSKLNKLSFILKNVFLIGIRLESLKYIIMWNN